ncbi:MAG: FtsL-like putative cell division protein [Rikenellaceae bacterium]
MEKIYFDTEEEEARRAEEEREAELARKISREVIHVQEDEYQDYTSQEKAKEEHERKLAERMERRRKRGAFWLLISGNILVNQGVSRYYPHMIAVVAMFFLSIMVMFYSLHQDMRYSRLDREVQLLRERSLRMQSDRYQRSSHSAIMEQLERRGIKLEEAVAPSTLID